MARILGSEDSAYHEETIFGEEVFVAQNSYGDTAIIFQSEEVILNTSSDWIQDLDALYEQGVEHIDFHKTREVLQFQEFMGLGTQHLFIAPWDERYCHYRKGCIVPAVMTNEDGTSRTQYIPLESAELLILKGYDETVVKELRFATHYGRVIEEGLVMTEKEQGNFVDADYSFDCRAPYGY